MQKEQAILNAPASTHGTQALTGMSSRGIGHGATGKFQLVVAIVLLATLPMAGCSAGQDGGEVDSGAGNVAQGTPPIHVSQTSVLLHNGEPAVAQTYRTALEHCSGAVTPLPPDVVGKLGRTYLETWFEGPRMAVKADRWDFKNADEAAGCQFQPVHTSTLTIVTPGRSVTADLVAKSATREDSEGVRREAVASAAKPAEGAADDDAKMRAAVMGELAKTGQGDLVAQDKGAATVAGQPCVQSANAQGETCVWSGGAAWGFLTDTAVTADRMDAPVDSIPLSVKPANGEGYRLTTESMSVGKPIDSKVFDLPADITVKPAG